MSVGFQCVNIKMSNQENDTVSKFDMSREVSSHYFKSSFARSMFSNSNQSKSLDFVYFDNSTIDEENENDSKTPTDDIKISLSKPPTSPLKRGYTAKGFEHKYETDFLKTSPRNQNNNAITFWKRKQVKYLIVIVFPNKFNAANFPRQVL